MPKLQIDTYTVLMANDLGALVDMVNAQLHANGRCSWTPLGGIVILGGPICPLYYQAMARLTPTEMGVDIELMSLGTEI